jgi:hypothetical protein
VRSDPEGRKWKQRDYPGAFDRDRQLALMFGTIARGSARYDLSAFGYEAGQGPHIFVVDLEGFVGAKPTDFSSSTRATAHSRASFAAAISFAARTSSARRVVPAWALAKLFGPFIFSHSVSLSSATRAQGAHAQSRILCSNG